MIVVLHRNAKDREKEAVKTFLRDKGFKIREIVGEQETVLGAVGLVPMDARDVEILPGVERVIPITKPYKLASRELKREDTVVSVGALKIGGSRITVMAGPCSVESREQIMESAQMVRECGAVLLRGGAYKPRTSPYSFQGLGQEGLAFLKEAGESVGMPVASEVVSADLADMMKEYVDVFQIGTRNMHNFELLKRVGSIGKPVILKRGMAATVEEWLMAAEYLLAHGTEDVILCERGIRTFETYTRNTLDLSAIPVIKELSHLPVIVDPSHATGLRDKVPPMGLAAIAAGADGLLIESHPDPERAMSDGAQSLYPAQLEKLMRDIEALSPVVGKEVAKLPRQREAAAVVADTVPDAVSEIDAVAFQGEAGAFSQIAVGRYFQQDVESIPCRDFETVFTSVLDGSVRYGVLPVENSLAGSIHENYDLLLRYPDVKIIGEQKIRIIHNLIGLPGAKISGIKKVYSHPQGLAQCAEFLQGLPDVERVPFYDTAGSVAHIAEREDPSLAAIASGNAAETYGMHVLKEGIETNPRNYTRFVVIARETEPDVPNPNMASIVFSTPDKPGALFICLKILADLNLNMTKLESRPIAGKPWEYMFYVDVQIEELSSFHDAVDALKSETDDFFLLGLYAI
jgi:3-deoxy-7-phosphoheptulonate synthase